MVWAANPWASACERTDTTPGELRKFWPTLIEPEGRVHFVGAYADNLNWGMEAATRSANRVAEAIHGRTGLSTVSGWAMRGVASPELALPPPRRRLTLVQQTISSCAYSC